MNKITKLSNYGQNDSLIHIGARLDGLDLQNMTGGSHTLTMQDGHMIYASGTVDGEDKFNYELTLEIGEKATYEGKNITVENIVFPHIIVNAGGEKERIHAVEYIASTVREIS